MMGQEMDLNFQLFETATLFITVIVVAFFLQEGTSNYFKGLMLILAYLIVAASFFAHEDPTSATAYACADNMIVETQGVFAHYTVLVVNAKTTAQNGKLGEAVYN
ncbi:hypothetical protein Gohar_001104, partial [Gossypium harknessii]|nr:hypothetical protein [Gossypium harknessii]